MSGIVLAALIVGVFALLVWMVMRAIESDRPVPWVIALGVVVTLSLGAIINAAMAEGASGPCLREETGMQYNPATKTVMPYTYCAERGTWQR